MTSRLLEARRHVAEDAERERERPGRRRNEMAATSSALSPSLRVQTAWVLQWITSTENLTEAKQPSVCAIYEAGVTWVQIRDLHASHAELVRAARVLKQCATHASKRTGERKLAIVNINHQVDERARERMRLFADAEALGCMDGLHLPERFIRDAQNLAITTEAHGKGGLLGCSVHSIDAAMDATRLGRFAYLQVGTMFPTQTHVGKEPEGVELMCRISSACPGMHLLGVGGILPENAQQVVAAGASGVAAIRSLDSPRKAQRLKSALSIKRS
ncbi:Thiamine-phosphate synthase [Porphyridium purpureum]|uniref:Thiamine-phosphate synthase n=1 Tax=Porphyridium purpureum TaxID=35688 RepID=A0A5J4YZD3_PORPP|nr:Thiamine-phosphate synthase [Porphyridium purpureum]|eukprot:POR7674..scf208_2